MRFDRLDRMTGGWFAGDFTPVAFATTDFEIAIKRYRAGDREPWHEHRIATEITVVVEGSVRIAGRTLGPGEIVVLEPGEAADFVALADSVTVCVKSPSAPGDKHVLGEAACE